MLFICKQSISCSYIQLRCFQPYTSSQRTHTSKLGNPPIDTPLALRRCRIPLHRQVSHISLICLLVPAFSDHAYIIECLFRSPRIIHPITTNLPFPWFNTNRKDGHCRFLSSQNLHTSKGGSPQIFHVPGSQSIIVS